MKSFVASLLLLPLVVGGCAGTTAGSAAATAPLDRAQMPAPSSDPSFDFPDVQRLTLSNGLPVWIVEKPGLPLVDVQLLLNAGAITEPADRAGLASLTAAMLTEGTTTRSASQIADEIDFLAASLGATGGRESATVTLSTLTRNLQAGLDIFADVIRNPAFAEAEFTRVRAQRLASIAQSRAQPGSIAQEELVRRVFGADHPYGHPAQGTATSVAALQVAALREFHSNYYRPGNSTLLVVGDVRANTLLPMLERALGGWQSATTPPVVRPTTPAAQPATTIYLIDRPGSAQSQICMWASAEPTRTTSPS
jgi:zinc protease